MQCAGCFLLMIRFVTLYVNGSIDFVIKIKIEFITPNLTKPRSPLKIPRVTSSDWSQPILEFTHQRTSTRVNKDKWHLTLGPKVTPVLRYIQQNNLNCEWMTVCALFMGSDHVYLAETNDFGSHFLNVLRTPLISKQQSVLSLAPKKQLLKSYSH